MLTHMSSWCLSELWCSLFLLLLASVYIYIFFIYNTIGVGFNDVFVRLVINTVFRSTTWFSCINDVQCASESSYLRLLSSFFFNFNNWYDFTMENQFNSQYSSFFSRFRFTGKMIKLKILVFFSKASLMLKDCESANYKL